LTRDQSRFWHIWIDTGGTFTDCLARDPDGTLHRAKVLSSSALRGYVVEQLDPQRLKVETSWSVPDNFIRGFTFRFLDLEVPPLPVEKYESANNLITLRTTLPISIPKSATFEVGSPEEAPILAARLVTGTTMDSSLPPMVMRLATTRGTNALLERKGTPTVLFITKGFADLLRIGTQQRPDLFALEIRKPEPLYEAVVEVEERTAADGSVLRPMNLNGLEVEIRNVLERGMAVAAVALMHSYRNPIHEQQLAKFLCARGFKHVSCSSELAPFIKLLPRAETTVVDAYLAPVIKDYFARVRSSLTAGRLYVMTSAGGLVDAREFQAKDSLLSGPAGGVVGAALAGRRSGFEKIIAFDMGGTSTDVARFDGDFEYVFEYEVGDAHLAATALAIESVAAGGGSICWFDGYRLRVGPESAAAEPGPACYGAGGPLTLTDVNLLLGRLDPRRFEIPVSAGPALAKLAELIETIKKQRVEKIYKDALLQGFLDIADERMADAIRRVSVRKGYDPQDYALVAFGGAGPQHACAVARLLGMSTILVPKDASLLSALGLGHAALERFAEKQVLQPLTDCESKINGWIDELTARAKQAVATECDPDDQIIVRRRLINLRFIGQDSTLTVEYDEKISLRHMFESKYKEIYGHLPEARAIEVESIRVVCSTTPAAEIEQIGSPQPYEAKPDGYVQTCFDGNWQSIPFYERARLAPGARFTGPALVLEQHTTVVIEVGWQAEMDGAGALVLNRTRYF